MLTVNGKTSNYQRGKPIVLNPNSQRQLSPVVNGIVPYHININGLDRPGVLPGCVFYAPMWHPALGGATFRSLDKNSHLCTVTGATYGRRGRTFASGDRVTSATSTSLEVASAATLACWVNVDSSVPNQEQLGIALDNRPTQTQRLELWVRRLNVDNNRIAYYDSVGNTVVSANSTAAVGSFSFLAATFVAGGSYNFYLNGAADGNGNFAANMPAWSAGTIVADIGNNANVLPFVGIGGEYWAYNRALTASEIRQIYLATKWRFA